ncbi:Calcineurin-like phosphoesterase superfamily domain-containing protein [Robiginitalea myxolifaciens]|uniref:Calcineurin-like phosphoesterase superfamily domain-containing protein n=1 Tax=Robiginitalea myxolifaciens TaxID=400055 RepID=A0A1I6G988_9FLAO|nr:metallophosphoesterase [Robiginitalea myxolifaciens]SFR38776.1 Calcineurin-like phosphoesterase superfamily domain-containing protein [Robiginitalea myxolifaciens]
MSTKRRLGRAYDQARIVPFDDTSRIIFFSDCHRGDNSFADDFSNNRNIYFHALKHYYREGFQYMELGDGDELWENIHFESLFEAHKNVYGLLRKFHLEKRLFMIWGNHDMVYQDPAYVEKHLSSYFEPIDGKDKELFEGIRYEEAIRLQHTETGQEIFCCHGHQADWWNYTFWRWSRFLVRVLWKPLQVWGIADPTSPAKNYRELIRIEKRIKRWILDRNLLMTIVGHTHRPRFPEPGEIPLFNDGSCVHPRSITGIEISEGKISLIKWQIATTEEGILQVVRKLLEGPEKLSDYAAIKKS